LHICSRIVAPTSLEEASSFGAGSLERGPDYEVVLLKHIMTKEIKNPVRKAQQSAYKGNLENTQVTTFLHLNFSILTMIFALCVQTSILLQNYFQM